MRFPQPSNEDEFELFCLRLLTIQWKREHLQPHGKRGERQHGIDIIDLVTDKPRRFAQCKHLESHKKLAAKTVREEVEKVLSSGYAIEEYWILSTGSRHSATQRAVIEINEAHAATRQFQVVVWTKDEIDAFLLALPPDVREYVIFGQIRELRSDSKSLVGLGTTIAEIRSGEFATDSATSATIARIQDLIAQHNPARAKIILEELLASLDRQRLPEADLYSLEVARFGIAMHEGNFVAAGSILYDAHQLLSTPTERSRVNQAIGLELQGKIEASNKVSSELLLEFPSSTRLLASWLRTLPDGFDLKACMERESAISTPDGDVTLALSNLAMRTSQYETAIDLAKKAVDLDPQSPQAWNVLGMSQHGLAGRQRGLGRTADLAVAKESYTKALKLARVQHWKGLAVQICLNLERVRRFLGDSPNEDLKEAIADGLSDEEMLTTVAEFFLEIGDVAEVLQVLSHARHPRSPKSRYVEGCALRKKLENADPDTSTLECFREALSDPNSPHYFPSIVFFIETAVRLKRFDQVNVALDKTVFADRHPILARLLRAWAIHVEGRHVEATALFDSCEVDLKLVDDKEELSVAGQVFGVVGRQEAALLCMERAWHHGEFDHVARALLDHAQRLKRHDIVIRVCSALREAGVSNDRLWKIEVTALQLYDPGAALKLARRWVTDYPNDKLAAFWVSILTHRLDRSAELTPDPSSWPPLEELSLVGAKCALGILLASKQPDVALNFAYQLLAQRFDEPEAHLTYTTTFLEAERIGSQGLFECSSASSNTAVYLEEAGRGVRVVVIGNEEPQEELDEVAANAPIARLLNDKRTGDVVIFDPQGLQPRKAVVREVTHKYVHRFRDCLETFQLRFPDRPAIQRINVGSEDSLDLEPIRRALELQRTGIAALERAYRETAIPVSAFAKIARRSELSTWRHLTTVDNLGVRVNLEGVQKVIFS